MNSKTNIKFGTMAIATVVLLFASGPMFGQQAVAETRPISASYKRVT
jgi:hypothetical protein